MKKGSQNSNWKFSFFSNLSKKKPLSNLTNPAVFSLGFILALQDYPRTFFSFWKCVTSMSYSLLLLQPSTEQIPIISELEINGSYEK